MRPREVQQLTGRIGESEANAVVLCPQTVSTAQQVCQGSLVIDILHGSYGQSPQIDRLEEHAFRRHQFFIWTGKFIEKHLVPGR
jgi:hypothetical protein